MITPNPWSSWTTHWLIFWVCRNTDSLLKSTWLLSYCFSYCSWFIVPGTPTMVVSTYNQESREISVQWNVEVNTAVQSCYCTFIYLFIFQIQNFSESRFCDSNIDTALNYSVVLLSSTRLEINSTNISSNDCCGGRCSTSFSVSNFFTDVTYYINFTARNTFGPSNTMTVSVPMCKFNMYWWLFSLHQIYYYRSQSTDGYKHSTSGYWSSDSCRYIRGLDCSPYHQKKIWWDLCYLCTL